MVAPRSSWYPRLYDRDEMLRLFRCHGDTTLVAEQMKARRGTVTRILGTMGVQLPHGRPPRFLIPRDEVESRYLAGENCRQIALDFDVDPDIVRMRLKRWGVVRRPGGIAGTEHPRWQGGKATERKEARDMHYYRRQSYEVAAICLGQPLGQGMVIHHLDENWRNNDPANLVVFPSQSIHARFHALLSKRQRAGLATDASHLALDSGGQALPKPRVPIQLPLGTNQHGPLRKLQESMPSPLASSPGEA